MKRIYVIFAGVFALLLIFGIQVVEQVDTPFLSAKANPYFSQPISLVQPTPYELLPPSTIAPSENYSVPPLSSLSLKVVQPYGSAIGGLIYIKGGSGNDINFRVINSQGKIILDLGRISNEKSFQFFADKTGNFTFIFDNEFSVFSSKEVDVFSYSYPNNLFEFAGFSINFWVIILVAIMFVTLIVLVVWLIRRKQK